MTEYSSIIKSNNNIKNRKGISTIVGSVFFIIVFTTATGYFLYSMNQLDKFGEAIISKGQEDRNVQQEEFQITSVTKDNNKFNVTIQNSGQIPVNVTRLWVQNRTDPSWTISKYTINQVVAPGQSLSKIGQSLPVAALPTQAYDLTVATDRGNTKEVLVNSASVKPIYLQLFALPETVPTGFTTTLLFSVTNNMSNNAALTNLKPNPPQVTLYGATATLVSGPDPPQYQFLNVGDNGYFKWVYNVTGTTGQKVNFQTSLQNGYLGNSVSRNVTINTIQGTTVKTFIHGGFSGSQTPGTSPSFLRIGDDLTSNTSYSVKNMTIPISGTFKNLYVSKGSASKSVTFTLYKTGGVATTLTCTVSSLASLPNCSDKTHSFTVVSGDTVAMGMLWAGASPTISDVRYTLEFDPS